MLEHTVNSNLDPVFRTNCPSRAILDQIMDKWSLMALEVLQEPRRFNAIKRCLDGITQRVLTQTLRKLERNGMVSRTVIAGRILGVESPSRLWAARSKSHSQPSSSGRWKTWGRCKSIKGTMIRRRLTRQSSKNQGNRRSYPSAPERIRMNCRTGDHQSQRQAGDQDVRFIIRRTSWSND